MVRSERIENRIRKFQARRISGQPCMDMPGQLYCFANLDRGGDAMAKEAYISNFSHIHPKRGQSIALLGGGDSENV